MLGLISPTANGSPKFRLQKRYIMPVLDPASQILLKNIIVATDFSPTSKSALRYATVIARHYRSSIFLVHAIEPKTYAFSQPETMDRTVDQLIKNAKQQMHDEAALFPDLELQQCIQQGTAVEAVQRMVILINIDLVVVGTRGTEGFGKLVLGSTAEQIFRQVRCPVLTVGPDVRGQDSIPELSHILLPADLLSDESRAVEYATSLTMQYKAHLTLLHVMIGTEPPLTEDKEAVIEPYRRRLEQLTATSSDLFYPPEYLVEFGQDAVTPILRVAKEQATDLIVLTVRRAEPWTSHLADKAYRIVAESPCPVLTIPEPIRHMEL